MNRKYNGEIYFSDIHDINSDNDLMKEFDTFEYDYKWILSDCIIIKKDLNENIKFDLISENKDEYPMFFNGFLYSDGTFLGKAKYASELNIGETYLKGVYVRLSEHHILIKGIWENPDNSREGFWAEIK